MVGELVKNGLHPHSTVCKLSEIATLEILSDGVVEGPERTAFEFLVARVAELLDGLVDVASRESLGIDQVNNHSGGITDLGLLVSVNALTHILPVGSDTGNG